MTYPELNHLGSEWPLPFCIFWWISNISGSMSFYGIPGHHDGRSGSLVDDESTGKEASVRQLHQRESQVHFFFVGRGNMRKM